MASPGASGTIKSGVDGGIAYSTTVGIVVDDDVVVVVVVVVAIVVVVETHATVPLWRHACIRAIRHRCRPLGASLHCASSAAHASRHARRDGALGAALTPHAETTITKTRNLNFTLPPAPGYGIVCTA